MGYVIFMFEFKKKHIFLSMQKKENPNSSKLFQNDGLYRNLQKNNYIFVKFTNYKKGFGPI